MKLQTGLGWGPAWAGDWVLEAEQEGATEKTRGSFRVGLRRGRGEGGVRGVGGEVGGGGRRSGGSQGRSRGQAGRTGHLRTPVGGVSLPDRQRTPTDGLGSPEPARVASLMRRGRFPGCEGDGVRRGLLEGTREGPAHESRG